jgi:Family of unknown function (DUF5670)
LSVLDRIWSRDAVPAQTCSRNCGKQRKAWAAFDGQQRALLPTEIRSFNKMLWTIAVILVVLWALGLTTAYSASGLLHILLVLAIIVVLIRVVQGRRAI